jgi:hypothetical protein
VMRHASENPHGWRLRVIIVLLWRGGLRVRQELALTEHHLDPSAADLGARASSAKRILPLTSTQASVSSGSRPHSRHARRASRRLERSSADARKSREAASVGRMLHRKRCFARCAADAGRCSVTGAMPPSARWCTGPRWVLRP